MTDFTPGAWKVGQRVLLCGPGKKPQLVTIREVRLTGVACIDGKAVIPKIGPGYRSERRFRQNGSEFVGSGWIEAINKKDTP